MRLMVGTRVGPFFVGASERVGRSPAQRATRRALHAEANARAWRDNGPVYRVGLVAWILAVVMLFAGFAFPPLFGVTVLGLVVGLICAGITGAREAHRSR